MDREAFEHGLVRRLLDHIDHHTTDMAAEVLEVPADAYTSREHLERELTVLFYDRPLVLCLSGALAGPGSYRTVDLCGTPVLVTRAADGKVRAMANICRHRGVRVVDGGGQVRVFTCPFHAWTYDLEGNLVGVPTGQGFEGMCREEKGLVQLPVAEGYGLVVGRLRPGAAIDMDEFLGPDLAGELAVLDYADWELYKEPHVHHIGANWKVTLDTFRENYHFTRLHRTTLAKYGHGGVLTFDAFGPHLRNTTAIKSIGTLREVPEAEWGDVSAHFSLQYQLFPNTSLSFDSRHIDLWQVFPVDDHTSAVVHSQYLRPGLSEEERGKAVDMAPWICKTVVDAEDFWVAGRTEPGIRTGLLDTVVVGRNEPALQHLHRQFLALVGTSASASSSNAPDTLSTHSNPSAGPDRSPRLDGRVAIVTGASSGLGVGVARALAASGARVAVVARRKDRLEDLAGEIGGHPVPYDLLDLEHVGDVVSEVADALGPPEIVVNAAGNRFGREVAEDEPLEDLVRTLQLNLMAPFRLSQAVFPHMVAVGRGSIVFISSISGHVGVPSIPQASYAASKMGLSGLAAELAVQWAARSIRVNTVAPGFFRSEITESLYTEERGQAWLRRNTPLPYDGDVEDIVGAVSWLASDAGRYVTGQTIVVDGGWTKR